MTYRSGELDLKTDLQAELSTLLDDPQHVYAVCERANPDKQMPAVTHNGIGNTFVSTFDEEPFTATVLHDVPVEVDIDGIEERETLLKSAIYADGVFLGGVDPAGILRISLDFYEKSGKVEDVVGHFGAALKRKIALSDEGIEPIFAPIQVLDAFEELLATGQASNSQTGNNLSKSFSISGEEAARAYADLAPKYVIEVKGTQFALSDMHANSSGRPAIILYPQDAQPIHYYQSRSHGVWRALLAEGVRSGQSTWYAKGMFGVESTTDAPLALQKKFAMLQNITNPDLRQRRDIMSLFVPQVPENPSLPPRARRYSARQPAEVIMSNAGISPTGSYQTYPNEPRDEQRIKRRTNARELFRRGATPDLSTTLDSWTSDTALYGTVTVRVVPSKNGVIHYALCESQSPTGVQRWIGTAEICDAPVTSLGLLQKWPLLRRSVTEPPIEYEYTSSGESAGYGELRTEQQAFERFVLNALAAYKGH